MNVLLVNKFFFEFGGADVVVFRLIRELEDAGHSVVPFSTEHPRNRETKWARYFVPHVSYRDNSEGPLRKLVTGLRSIYSPVAARNLNLLLDAAPPIDVAHLHNFNYEITTSILPVLAKRRIPVVWTMHDPQLVCPYHRLYDYRTHEICEDCAGGRFYRAPLRGCIQGSRLKSAVGAAEAYYCRWNRVYERYVTLFTTPSRFLKEKVIAMGAPVEPDRIVHVPNGVDVNNITPAGDDDGYLLYFGRLSAEKGIHVLLEATEKAPGVRLVVAGEGPDERAAHQFVETRGLADRIVFAGYRSGDDLQNLVRRARACVLPSTGAENHPIAILESFASAKPVVASDIGGIPELVSEGETGLLVPPGDPEALALAMRRLSEATALARQMGRNARRLVEEQYDWKSVAPRFIKAYALAAEREVSESAAGHTRKTTE